MTVREPQMVRNQKKFENHCSTATWFAQTYILRKDLHVLFVGICHQPHVTHIALR